MALSVFDGLDTLSFLSSNYDQSDRSRQPSEKHSEKLSEKHSETPSERSNNFSSSSSSQVDSRNDSFARDQHRLSLQTDSLGKLLTGHSHTVSTNTSSRETPFLPLYESPRKKNASKEQILAFRSYVSDINFSKRQQSFLNAHKDEMLPVENKRGDFLSVTSNLIPGLSLSSPLDSDNLLLLVFHAFDEENQSRPCLVRISPNMVDSMPVARFLNEWYVTSGLNPPSRHRPWCNQLIENLYIPLGRLDIHSNESRQALLDPVTLPPNIAGVLYPTRVLNIDTELDHHVQRRLGLVYPDYGFRTIREYYSTDKKKDIFSDSSLSGTSIRSVLSDLTQHEKPPPLDKYMIRENLGTGNFDDLSNRVSQLPKDKKTILSILLDVLSVVSTIASCHELGIVHNGITSRVILKGTECPKEMHDKNNSVFLAGWDFSFSIGGENSSFGYRRSHLSDIPEYLPYMSPENSGETYSFVDYRTDMYSLGIVLYELIVGCLPFQSENPMRLRRMHLTQKPISPLVLGQGWISEDLNDIIMKCLEKDPADRYLNARALLRDLREVKNDYARVYGMESSDHLHEYEAPISPIWKDQDEIPSLHTNNLKLKETPMRKEIFETINNQNDGLHFVMLKGDSGVGKTSILQEIRSIAVSKYHFCSSWSFNCADMNVTSYEAAMHRLHDIIKQILASSKEYIAEWRHKLITEIDTDLSILFHAIPELEFLLGPRYQSIRSSRSKNGERGPVANGLKNQSAENSERSGSLEEEPTSEIADFDEHALNFEMKVKFIVKKFFTLVCPHGFLLLMDDIQWIQPSELEFFEDINGFLKNSKEPLNLTIFCTYRTGDAISQIDEAKYLYEEVRNHLAPLLTTMSEFQMTTPSKELFSDLMTQSIFTLGRAQPANLDTFTDTLYKTTNGNFLRFHYILRTLQLKNENNKQDLDRMQHLFDSEELPVSMESIINNYISSAIGPEAQELLKFAAIIASNSFFRLSDLMIVTGKSLQEVYQILHACLEARVLIPAGIHYKIPFHLVTSETFPFDLDDSLVWKLATKARYQFDHDLIQAYLLRQLHEEGQFKEFHKICGLRHQKKLSRDTHLDVNSYLTMAYHLLIAEHESTDEDRDIFFETFKRGGRYALATSNLKLSLAFFKEAGKHISPADKRKKMKNLLTICQMNFYLENYEECLSIIAEAEKIFGSESSTFLILKVQSLIHLRHLKQGMRAALKGFQVLGLEVSSDPVECEDLAEKYMSRAPLSISEIRSTKDLKPARSNKLRVLAELMLGVIGPTYVLGMSRLRLALLAQLVITIKSRGLTSHCAIPLIYLANYFIQPHQRYSATKAMALCDLALGLVTSDTKTSPGLYNQVYEVYVVYMAKFRHTPTELVTFIENFRLADSLFVNTKTAFLMYFFRASTFVLAVLTGLTSASMQKELENFSDEDEQTLSQGALGLWMGETKYDDYKTLFSTLKGAQRLDTEFVFLANSVLWLVAQGRFNEAAEIMSGRCYTLLRRLPISILHLEFYFYGAIALCFSTSAAKKTDLKLAKKITKFYSNWSNICPQNFQSKQQILDACTNASMGELSSLSVLDDFEIAIETAAKCGRWIEAGFANYLCARWLASQNESKRRVSGFANAALSIFTTLDFYDQTKRIEKEFSTFFDSFNWAGVSTMPELEGNERSGMTLLNSELQKIFTKKDNRNIDIKSLEKLSIHEQALPQGNTMNEEPTQTELTKAIKLCLSIAESSNTDLIVTSLLESTLLFSNVDYGAIVLSFDVKEPVIKMIGTLNNIYKLEETLGFRTDLVPYHPVVHCLLTGETINKEDDPRLFDEKFATDHYYLHNPCTAAVCIPIKTSTVLGAIYLEKHATQQDLPGKTLHFNSRKIDLIELLSCQAAVSLGKSIVYSQLELAKKAAEDATAEKASFLANMSHEIRTPFNSLFACSLFLLDTNLTETQREYVDTIKSSALVTLNIIDGILAFSKIEHGSFTLNNAPFDINDCVESAIQATCEPRVREDLQVAFFNLCPEIKNIVGDATRVRQIIINLVGNALKFTLEGYIKIFLKATHIDLSRYEIQFVVEDTGIGIPEKAKSKVFGAFSQVDSSSRRVYGGSGLGLAITKKLADIMNGTITFDSVETEGTTFYFSCPFEVSKTVSFDHIKPQKVAIVSPQGLKREALELDLTLMNASTKLFDSSEKYLASRGSYDVVFIDQCCLDQLREHLEKTRKDNTRKYLLAVFGCSITKDVLNKLGIASIIFAPYKRTRIEEILLGEDIKKKEQSNQQEKLADIYPLSILLAEDNAINLRVALQHLKKMGYTVDHAKDGVEVLEKIEAKLARDQKYDVIFMDIQMPRKDGIAATIELKELLHSRNLAHMIPQIVALTANVAGEDREKCLNCGMVDFVTKPILPEELRKVLTKIGESH